MVSLTVVLLMSACNSTRQHPSDLVLEKRLRSQQADFDSLVRMFEEDSDVVKITHNNVFFDESPIRNLPKGRLDTYRSLLKTLRLEGGIKRERGHILLFASIKGMVIPNSGKTYLYSETEPSPLVESLDGVITNNSGTILPHNRSFAQGGVIGRAYSNYRESPGGTPSQRADLALNVVSTGHSQYLAMNPSKITELKMMILRDVCQ